MCGIAGYSLSPESSVQRTLAAQALLAGIAERGADAVGYAHRGSSAFGDRPQAPLGRQRAARRAARAVGVHAGARARARLHQGPSHDRGEQPSDPPRLGRRDPQRDHRQRRGDLRPLRLRARPSGHDRRLRGDLRARRARRRAAPRRSRSCTARWRPPGSTSGTAPCSSSPAPSAGRCGSAAPPASSSSPRPAHALDLLEQTLRLTLRKREVDEGTLLRVEDGRITRTRALQARPLLRRGDDPPRRARPARGRLVPAAARRDHARGPPALGSATLPSAATSAPSSRSRSRTRNWNAAHAGWTSIIR